MCWRADFLENLEVSFKLGKRDVWLLGRGRIGSWELGGWLGSPSLGL